MAPYTVVEKLESKAEYEKMHGRLDNVKALDEATDLYLELGANGACQKFFEMLTDSTGKAREAYEFAYQWLCHYTGTNNDL
jgi:hypothetical protein